MLFLLPTLQTPLQILNSWSLSFILLLSHKDFAVIIKLTGHRLLSHAVTSGKPITLNIYLLGLVTKSVDKDSTQAIKKKKKEYLSFCTGQDNCFFK